MRIAHLCLSNWYVDDWGYQENELIAQHAMAGHDVLVLASTEVPSQNGVLQYVKPSTYQGRRGGRIVRIPYRRGPLKVMRKLRMHPGVMQALETFKPEAILFHGACGWEVMTAAKYVRNNPGVVFYIDCHEDFHNSARNFISRELLHKIFYRACLVRAMPEMQKLLCISLEAMRFAHVLYGVPEDKLEFFPLGGTIPDDAEYATRRARARARYGAGDDSILFVQAGKQTAAKKLVQSLKAFAAHASDKARLVVAGSMDEETAAAAMPLIEADPRVIYAGWLGVEDMADVLCGADVYLQPGTQSVTMQNSLCCRCPVILADYPSHHAFIDGNGWLVSDEATLANAIAAACAAELAPMSAASLGVARRLLDYEQLSRRVLR